MVNLLNKCARGFTLIELMLSMTVLAILLVIAIPNFSYLLAQLRTNSEISTLHRLLLVARNNAINLQQPVTICPLNIHKQCHTNWQNEISVFTDINDNKIFEPSNGELLISVKNAIPKGDKLQYALRRNRIKYAPTGRTTGWGSNGTFKYCSKNHAETARGIVIATSGRIYLSTDIDNDGRDEVRGGNKIICR